MDKLTDILKQTLSKIDEINDYMFMVGEFLINDMKKIEKKSKTGFLIGIYLDSQFQEKKDEAETNEEIQKKVKEAEMLADKYIEILNVDSEIGIVSYRHKGKKKINVEKDTQNMYKGFSRILMFYNSLLINLIIEFESYISDIFMYYIQKYPEAYLSNESIKYTMISSIDDIAEIKLMIKRKTVEQIMRENIFSWFKLLKEKHKINVNIENSFIEAYYRRNLVVHNNLIVNNDYLENIPNSIEKPQINEKLKINLKYLKKVIKDEKKIIINLLYAIDKKENDNEDVIDALTDYAYDCMREGKWQTSTYIYDLVKDDKRMNVQDKLNCKVNYWQSMKRLNKFEDVKTEIENLDISAYEKIYKLAKEVLLEEYGNAIRTLELIYKNDITSNELEEWPLFLEFRETKEFKEFKEKHNDDFLEKEKNINSNFGIKERIEELNNTDDNK